MTDRLNGINPNTLRNKFMPAGVALAFVFLGCGAMAQAPCAETYTVQSGDTFYGIANDHDLTAEQITNMNPKLGSIGIIQSGQEICVGLQ